LISSTNGAGRVWSSTVLLDVLRRDFVRYCASSDAGLSAESGSNRREIAYQSKSLGHSGHQLNPYYTEYLIATHRQFHLSRSCSISQIFGAGETRKRSTPLHPHSHYLCLRTLSRRHPILTSTSTSFGRRIPNRLGFVQSTHTPTDPMSAPTFI